MSAAYDWYEEREPGLGAKFLLAVDEVIGAILQNPLRFQRVHRTARRALTYHFPYAVYFVVDEERIVVLSVFHAKRNPRRWQGRI